MGPTQSVSSDGCGHVICIGDTFLVRGVSGKETARYTLCSQTDVPKAASSARFTGRRVLSSIDRIAKIGAMRAMPAIMSVQQYAELLLCALVTTSCRHLRLLLSRWSTQTTFLWSIRVSHGVVLLI